MQAPARRSMRAGVLLFLCAVAACDRGGRGGDEGPRVLELLNDTIQLAAGVRLIDVKVERGPDGDFDPALVQAIEGDVVRFTAADNGGHAIAFNGLALAPEARAHLERTGQLRGPPLITVNAAWVITLAGAPVGAYPFRCTTHDVAGRLIVGTTR
ncbi:MAG TPA: hypothetical protein VMN60_04605 [Longimicrobiales bacterium]|nr:hypothetical protein [Longimicrobiales bacterium]